MGIIKFNMLLLLALVSSVVAEIEIAPYTVLKDHGNWEEREFPAMKWISVDGVSSTPNDDSNQYFFRLFNYIDGQNSEEMKIDMTAPVSFKIYQDGNFTMSFFIPMVPQENPPQPNDEGLYVEERPAMTVAAKRFGRYPDDDKFMQEAGDLRELVLGAGLVASEEPLWTAGYSAPFQIILRGNEVWLEI